MNLYDYCIQNELSDLLKEWNVEKNGALSIRDVTSFSSQKVWWKCKNGHEWEAKVDNRARGAKCPYCTNKRVLAGYNDLKTENPELASEWNYIKNAPLKPEEFTSGSNVKVWWIGKCGHEWQQRIGDRKRGQGCPYCEGNAVLEGFNDLASQRPDLVDEWDFEDNNDISPSSILLNANKKVSWICKKGHKYLSSPYRRSRGAGCPICSNVQVLEGYNDLKSRYPQLVTEWDYDKNEIAPNEVVYGSAKKVWWKCKQGHEWQAAINKRITGVGCPYCSNHAVLSGDNDLLSNYPDLAQEWNYEKNGQLLPNQVLYGSHMSVWWVDEHGHEWKAPIRSRVKGCGCPYCAGQRLLKGFNDLLSQEPQIAKEWNYDRNGELKPDDVYVRGVKKVWWICAKGHEWQEAPVARTQNGYSCPYCSNKRVLTGYNDLATTNVEIASEWHPTKNGKLTPHDVTDGSGKTVWWLGKCGHEWKASINGRCRRGDGCPYCYNNKLLIGFNDLATADPDLANEWHPTKNGDLKPSDVMRGSGKKVWWKCAQGHEWITSVGHRMISKSGCPYCYGNKLLAGYNDLETVCPELAKEWHPTKNGKLTPRDVTSSCNTKVWWLGRCGHEFKTMVSDRKHGGGCPICNSESLTSFPEQAIFFYVQKYCQDAENRYIDDKNEIDVYIPSLNIGIEYDGIYYHKNKEEKEKRKETFFANKGIMLVRVKEAEIDDVAIDGNVIRYNYKKQLYLGKAIELLFSSFLGISAVNIDIEKDNEEILAMYLRQKKDNSIARNEQLMKEWNSEKNGYLNPEYISQFSGRKVWWKCSNGHEWKAVVSARSNGTGCPYCAGSLTETGVNDLMTLNPSLAEEWNYEKNEGIDIRKISLHSSRRVWWKCKMGHEWQTRVARRALGDGCPFCAGQKTITGENDLATVNPVLAEEWHPTKNGDISPQDVMAGSGKNVWWLGKCGHEWEQKVFIRNQGSDCPYCASRKLLKGFNDLKTKNPELAEEWDYQNNGDFKPDDVMPGSNKKVWWKCKKCGGQWQAVINNRNRGTGCPYCKD